MSRQFTQKQRQLMRKSLQKFSQNGIVIVYGFAKKQSGTGLFSNQRLLLLHSEQKSIRYYSKEPQNLPFDNVQTIPQGKDKVITTKVNNFKCENIKGKTSTLKITWEQNKVNKEWQFTFSSSKMMNQWISAVQQMQSGKINKDPVFVQSLPSNNSKVNTPIGNLNPLLNSNSSINPNGNLQPKPLQNQKNNSSNLFILQENDKKPSTQLNNTKVQPKQQIIQPQNDKNRQNLNSLSNSNINNTNKPLNNSSVSPNQLKSDSLLNNPNQGYGDVASQLKALRNKQPQRFNLTNDLSKKNLNQVQPNSIEADNYQTKRNQPGPVQQINNPASFSKKNEGNNYINQGKPKPQVLNSNPSMQNNQNLKKSNLNLNSNKNLQQSNNSNLLNRQSLGQKSIKTPGSNYQYLPNQESLKFDSQALENVPKKYETKPEALKAQPSSNNLKKSSSTLNKSASLKKWNQLWCSVGNQIQIYQQFVLFCQQTSIQIIDELPLLKSNRQYSPIKFNGPYFVYDVGGITFNMHFFEDESPLQSSRDQDERAPLLFDHQSYSQSKREFYNFNYVLSITGNKNIFKVPLSCYVQYKGVLIYCKANTPQGFSKSTPNIYQKQLQELEQQIKMRFIFSSLSLAVHPQKKYFLIMDLDELIPRIPIQVYPPVYFRKQFLTECNFMIQDQNSVKKLYQILTTNNIKQFINRFQTLESWVINSIDLFKELHRSGISLGCLPLIYEQTNLPFLKKIISSQMTKTVFCDILRSQLNSVYSSFPAKQFDELTIQYIDKIILDCAHVLLDQLFSYSSRSENIWRIIVKQANKKFKVIISKQDILAGYLLGGIMESIGIDCDYKTPNLNRKQSFFVHKNSIPRDLLLNFYLKVRRYDLQKVSPIYSRTLQLLSLQPSPDHFQQMVRSLSLRSKPLPSFLKCYQPQILTYLCNFVPFGDHHDFDHMGLYDMLEQQPHTFCSTKVSLLGIKWAAKKKNQELAHKIFEIKYQQNIFWVSEFNPAMSQYYDFFSLYNVSTGNYEQSVKLAKSSLVNSIKLTGSNSLPVADKHYQLGNILFKISRKQQALKQYLKTKQILQQHKQTSIPQYGIILLKLALLYLNFGKISDCIGNSFQALKIFEANGGSEQEQIQTFEIVSRSYQITRKSGDLASVGALCSKKFNNTENIKIFQRMIKIVLLPKLASLSHQDAKTLLKITAKIQQLDSPISALDSFNYLHARAEQEVIMKKVFSFLDNISNLYQQVIRKDLFRKHKSLSSQTRSQSGDMLVLMEAVFVTIGFNFINGSLRENYY